MPSGFASWSSGARTCVGAFWKATGRRKRRIAVIPTEVGAGAVVAGYGPPWCMPWVTATPVGKPSKISRPLRFRPLLELANQITVGLLPARVREQYGFSWDPVRAVALHGGAEYVKRVLVPVLPERVRMLPMARAA